MNLIQSLAFATVFLTSLSTTTIQQIEQLQTTQNVVQPKIEVVQLVEPTQATTTPEFEAIAKCESRNDPQVKNKYSSASGRFQFLWGTWYHYGTEYWGDKFYEKNIWDFDDNTELAWYVYSKYGTKDWNESKSCWSKTSTVDG